MESRDGSSLTPERTTPWCGLAWFLPLSLAEIPGGLLDVTGRRSTLYGPTMVSLEIEGVTLQQNVYVAPDMCDDVILGLDFLRQNRCILDSRGRGSASENAKSPSVPRLVPQAGISPP